MLASITPLGERGRHSHWPVTITAFVLAATVAGAVAGALLGAVGGALAPGTFTGHARLLVAGGLSGAALVLDVVHRVPGPRRQVDERWLDRYRGWVCGLGYGAQLGLGITTVVTSTATYAAFAIALETGQAGAGAVILGLYGALRGLTPLTGARVSTPLQLIALHARFARARPTVTRVGGVLLGAGAVVGVVAGLT